MKEKDFGKIQGFLGEEICNILPNKKFAKLYQRITYIILKFLQSEDKDTSNILFIHYPLEDLTNKITDKDKYWKELCDVIVLAIRLSMKTDTLQPSDCPYPGDWYSIGDKYLLLPSEGDKYPYYFLEAINGEEGKPKLEFSCKNPNYPSKISDKNNL